MNENFQIDPPDRLAFHGSLGAYVDAIQDFTEADPAAILVQGLVAFGNYIGRSAFIRIDQQRHHGNLYALPIGTTTSGRKGSALTHAMEPYRRLGDDPWCVSRQAHGLSSGEGLIHAVRDATYAIKQVPDSSNPKKKILSREIVDAGVDDKRLFVTAVEFSATLVVMGREGNILSEELRSAWDGGVLQNLTRKSERATDAHISVVGHITPDELLHKLDTIEMSNGLCNRFLFFLVHRQKLLPDAVIPDKPVNTFAEAITLAQGFISRGAAPLEMRLSDDSSAAWRILYGEGQQAGPLNQERSGILGALIARGAPQIKRIALIYALLDCSPVIELCHLLAAVAVWDFSVRSVEKLFGDTTGVNLADEILKALRATPEGLTRTEISSLFSNNRDARHINDALTLLLKEQLARYKTEEISEHGGRPAQRWVATPGRASLLRIDFLGPFRTGPWLKRLRASGRAMKALWEKTLRERQKRWEELGPTVPISAESLAGFHLPLDEEKRKGTVVPLRRPGSTVQKSSPRRRRVPKERKLKKWKRKVKR